MTTITGNTDTRAYITPADERTSLGRYRILWGPIMIGVVCAIGLQFIFTVLGIALGTSGADAMTTADGAPVRTISMAAGLWWLITGTLALAAGGFVFGTLAGLPRSLAFKFEAAALWGVVALFGFFVVWSGAGMMSQAASPFAAMSVSNTSVPHRTFQPSGADLRPQAGAAPSDESIDRPTVDEARRAARAASWWSVIGLIAGLSAAIGGACAGAGRVTTRHI